jgi:hypothetical protein
MARSASILNTCTLLGHANGYCHTASFVTEIAGLNSVCHWQSPGFKPGGMDIAGFPKRATDFRNDMNGQRTPTAPRIGAPAKAVLDRLRICFRSHSNQLHAYD